MNNVFAADRSRRWLASTLFALAVVALVVVFRGPLAAWFGGSRAGDSGASTPGASIGDIDHYTCSMHPSVKQRGPGTCPICGMALIPVEKAQQEQGIVTIDESRRQLIGVRTGRVIEGPMRRTFHAVGRVAYDESALTDVNLKVKGFITKLFVTQTGQKVTAGQPLFLLYSPELYNAEQDFLLATGPSHLEALGRAARQRLHLLGLDERQIDALTKKGAPHESIAIPAPASGFVIEKNVVEGAAVDAGARLYRIAALNKVWVEADVYEADLPLVRVGAGATVTLDYLPGRSYEAKVAYVYPYLDQAARTGRVRVELANKGLDLRPGMYANVALASDAESRVQVPAPAVVYTGPRRLVFVDLGEGRFRPQEIQIGSEANGMFEVLSGLRPGDTVATSGVFLIAAEARISTAAKYWEKTADASETMPSAPVAAIGSSATVRPAAVGPAATPPATAQPATAQPATAQPATAQPATAQPATARPATAAVFSCPMHPDVRSATPGKCPQCGMDLELAPRGGLK